MIGDGHTVSVGPQVTKCLLGSAERWLAIDHPALNIELADQASKQFGLNKPPEAAMELELSRGVSLQERCREFAAEDLAENSYRKEKAVTTRLDPVAVIRRQATSRYDTVDVRMIEWSEGPYPIRAGV